MHFSHSRLFEKKWNLIKIKNVIKPHQLRSHLFSHASHIVACLVLTKSTRYDPISKQLLQPKSISICDGSYFIESLKSLVIQTRQKVDELYSKCYKKALTLTEKINILIVVGT